MQIFNQENVISNVAEHISTKYALKKVAVFVDENEQNKEIINQLSKTISNKIIENKPISEDVAFCVVCGNYLFQQECLKTIMEHSLPYGYIITNLGQSSFLMPCLQEEKLVKVNSPEFIAFEKTQIKKQAFSSNLAVVSFLQTRMLALFEREYYSRIFEAHYVLECKQKALSICDAINGIADMKLKNPSTANTKILDATIKYLKLQQKYEFLEDFDAVANFAFDLTKHVFKNFYENLFIASVFATSLMEKYFSLSFENEYSFSYEKNLKHCCDNFNNNIIDFQNAVVSKKTCYKLQINKEYFINELFAIKTKLILKKYDNLCIFSDFGLKLVQILQELNIKDSILKVANLPQETIFKQIRNVGLLDF